MFIALYATLSGLIILFGDATQGALRDPGLRYISPTGKNLGCGSAALG